MNKTLKMFCNAIIESIDCADADAAILLSDSSVIEVARYIQTGLGSYKNGDFIYALKESEPDRSLVNSIRVNSISAANTIMIHSDQSCVWVTQNKELFDDLAVWVKPKVMI